MVTLEQVEKLCEKANISYDEARKVLEKTEGDLLEAVVLLEKEGKIEAPRGNGYYDSRETDPGVNGRNGDSSGNFSNQNTSVTQVSQNQGGRQQESTFGDSLNSFFRWFGKILHIGNTNSFEVRKDGKKVMVFPVTVFVLLLFFAFWITIPLMIIGLFFGLRYVFSGPEVRITDVNKAMNTAADAAEDFKSRIKYENNSGSGNGESGNDNNKV